MSPADVPNVLATRYASPEMAELWSARHKVILERRLWIAVLEAQRDAGVDMPDGALDAYRSVITQVDLDSITERERITRHDVKARIEEFCALAGHEQIHRAMTSRDLTENVEQCQVRASLALMAERMAALIVRIAALACVHRDLVMTARTHNVPAQATTLGKRWATIGTEALASFERIEDLIARYPLRGIRGPVGTQQDMLELLDGDQPAVDRLERRIADELGFERVLGSAGQVYPPLAGSRRRRGACRCCGSARQSGAQRAPGSWPGVGERGLRCRPGRLIGHAPQDEHTLLRAHQRPRDHSAGAPDDGLAARRRPMGRG